MVERMNRIGRVIQSCKEGVRHRISLPARLKNIFLLFSGDVELWLECSGYGYSYGWSPVYCLQEDYIAEMGRLRWFALLKAIGSDGRKSFFDIRSLRSKILDFNELLIYEIAIYL